MYKRQAALTQNLLHEFDWEVLDHPPYSLDLAPSDYHLFTDLKKWLGAQGFDSNDELKSSVADWLTTQE